MIFDVNVDLTDKELLEASKKFFNNDKKRVTTVFQGAVKYLFEEHKFNLDNGVLELQNLLPIYMRLYKNKNTLAKRLSEIRKVIKEFQPLNLYIQSTYDTVFNIGSAMRKERIDDHNRLIKETNSDIQNIQLDNLLGVMKTLRGGDKHDRLIFVLINTGARVMDYFVNDYKVKDKQHLIISNLAKSKDKSFETTRPVLYYTAATTKRLWDASKGEFNAPIDSNGEVHKSIMRRLNAKIKLYFPTLDLTSKSFRKIYASLAYKKYAKNENYNVFIQKVLGHTSLGTTFSYSAVSASTNDDDTALTPNQRMDAVYKVHSDATVRLLMTLARVGRDRAMMYLRNKRAKK